MHYYCDEIFGHFIVRRCALFLTKLSLAINFVNFKCIVNILDLGMNIGLIYLFGC